MDHRHSARDALYSTLCKTEVALMYCNVRHTPLCKDRVMINFSYQSKVHAVVRIEQFLSSFEYPNCQKHPNVKFQFVQALFPLHIILDTT